MRGLSLSLLLVSPGLCAQDTTADTAPENPTVRWYDVRALDTLHVEDRGVDMRLHLASSFVGNLEPEGYDVEVEDNFSPDEYDWSQLILDALGEDWPDDQLFVDERSGMLRIEGLPQTQAEVAKILAELEERFLRTVRLELFALRAEDVSASLGSVLSAAEVDALLAEADLLEYARTSASPGRSSRLGRSGSRSIVMDYDVEVAQHARSADPVVTVLREGIELGVLPIARDEGGFFLRIWGRQGLLAGGLRQLTLDSLGAVPIELPAMQTTLSTASANVPDGGGILVGQDWNASGWWLIRATSETAEAAGGPFVSLAELTAMPLFLERPEVGRASPSGGEPENEWSLSSQLDDDVRGAAFAEDDIIDRLWDEREELDLGGSLQLLGSDLYVRGSRPLLEHVRKSVQELRQAITGTTVEIDLRLGVLDRATAIDLVRNGNEAEILARLDRRVLGSARLGDTLVVVGGKESFYLQDHDVEIAQAAAISDPVVANVFDGVSFWCMPNRVGRDQLSLLVELTVQRHPDEPRQVAAMAWQPHDPGDSSEDNLPTGGLDNSALIELLATTRAGTRTQVVTRDGVWNLLMCSGFGGEELMLVALLRATRSK